MASKPSFRFLILILSLQSFSIFCLSTNAPSPPTVCIVGGGIGGSSVAHFLRQYFHPTPTQPTPPSIKIFERRSVVGGRMGLVNIGGETFEAGASILHPKNYHARNYSKLLGLKVKPPPASEDDDSMSLGIWDGKKFVFKTFQVDSKFPFVQKIVSLVNNVYLFFRYGFSLLKMNSFVESTVDSFLKYYESPETRPVFETVDEMLKWAGLYNLTTRPLLDELVDIKLSPLLIEELITVITRINYGQSVYISGLAGAVSLAGSGGGLWSIEGGNWQMAAGLINTSDVSLHLSEVIESISYLGEYYELNSTKGNSYSCEVAVVATPLDEVNIQFTPSISIPERKLQHTHTTFVRGLLNPAYFGLSTVAQIPELIGTLEDPDIPFSSISVLKCYDEKDVTYKVFSREPMADALLDSIFSTRQETIRINWGAYPHYEAPEVFAPFILDGQHLYYVNAFENAASTMETMAVAAENVARLILSRYFNGASLHSSNLKKQQNPIFFSETSQNIQITLSVRIPNVDTKSEFEYIFIRIDAKEAVDIGRESKQEDGFHVSPKLPRRKRLLALRIMVLPIAVNLPTPGSLESCVHGSCMDAILTGDDQPTTKVSGPSSPSNMHKPRSIDISPCILLCGSLSLEETMSTCNSLISPEFDYVENEDVLVVKSDREEGKQQSAHIRACAEREGLPEKYTLGDGTNENADGFDKTSTDPQFCAPIARDIYMNPRASEAKKRPSVNFMEMIQKDINACMRAVLIDWRVEILQMESAVLNYLEL
ncbi:Prenylcysteine lyase [Corchorus capsularis]|uniref:Prenylcysteine lyase n=1 Tax=Corchorus capsularis TaxID=210143 RepID=A0A1R3GGP4_COCAP|nr:Prenylcysteine lyase [Corchorus capsularis]